MSTTPTLSTYHEESDSDSSNKKTLDTDVIIEEFNNSEGLDALLNNSTVIEKDISDDMNTADGYFSNKLNGDLNEDGNGRNGYEITAKTISDVFGAGWNGNFSEVSTQLTTSVSNIATTTTALATMSELLKSNADDLSQQAKTLVYSKLGSQISVIQSKYADITKWINTAKTLSKINLSYESIKNELTNPSGILETLNDSLDAADKFLSNVDDLDGLIDKCIDSVSDWFSPIVDAGKETVGMLTSTITSIGDGISSFFDNTNSFLNKLSSNGISSALSSFPTSIINKLLGINIVQDLLVLPFKIIALIPAIVVQLTSFPMTAPTSFAAIKGLITYFKKVLSLLGEIKSTTDKLVNSINTVKKNIENLVSNVSKGNWTGILALLIGGGTNFIQNVPTFKAVYPMNQAHVTPGGILIQLDNSGSVGGTNGASITMPDSSNADFDGNGNLNLHPQGNMQLVTESNTQIYSKKDISLDATNDLSVQVKNIKLSSSNDTSISATNNLSLNGKSINFSGTSGVSVNSNTGLSLSSATDVGISSPLSIAIKTLGSLTLEAKTITMKCEGAYTDFVGGARTIATAGLSTEVCGANKSVNIGGAVENTVGGKVVTSIGGAYTNTVAGCMALNAGEFAMINADSNVSINAPTVSVDGGIINLL